MFNKAETEIHKHSDEEHKLIENETSDLSDLHNSIEKGENLMITKMIVLKKRKNAEKRTEKLKYCRIGIGAIVFAVLFPGICPGLILKLSSDSLYKREPMEEYLLNEVFQDVKIVDALTELCIVAYSVTN